MAGKLKGEERQKVREAPGCRGCQPRAHVLCMTAFINSGPAQACSTYSMARVISPRASGRVFPFSVHDQFSDLRDIFLEPLMKIEKKLCTPWRGVHLHAQKAS